MIGGCVGKTTLMCGVALQCPLIPRKFTKVIAVVIESAILYCGSIGDCVGKTVSSDHVIMNACAISILLLLRQLCPQCASIDKGKGQ